MLTVTISYRRIGDDPANPPRKHVVEEVASPLAAANEAQRFCLDNLDAEILHMDLRESLMVSFSLSGYVRTEHTELTEDHRLQIAQHMELCLAEYLDELNAPASEVQVRLSKVEGV